MEERVFSKTVAYHIQNTQLECSDGVQIPATMIDHLDST